MRNLQLESTKLEIRSKCVKRSPEKFADNENFFGKKSLGKFVQDL